MTETPSPRPAQKKKKAAARKPARPAFDPRIVVFACNWCSYAGADTAGVSRIQHQPHFRMIRVMCSGRIQPAFVLRAFEKGADGVLVSGCHFGDCHYIFGNERAVEQFEKTMNVVKLLGIDEGRLRLEWISAAEGSRFAEVIDEFTDQVRAIGPSPFALSDAIDEIEVPDSETETGTETETGKGMEA
jgi:F420-non-reducing hydrogenase iron-sulfur subunit